MTGLFTVSQMKQERVTINKHITPKATGLKPMLVAPLGLACGHIRFRSLSRFTYLTACSETRTCAIPRAIDLLLRYITASWNWGVHSKMFPFNLTSRREVRGRNISLSNVFNLLWDRSKTCREGNHLNAFLSMLARLTLRSERALSDGIFWKAPGGRWVILLFERLRSCSNFRKNLLSILNTTPVRRFADRSIFESFQLLTSRSSGIECILFPVRFKTLNLWQLVNTSLGKEDMLLWDKSMLSISVRPRNVLADISLMGL